MRRAVRSGDASAEAHWNAGALQRALLWVATVTSVGVTLALAAVSLRVGELCTRLLITFETTEDYNHAHMERTSSTGMCVLRSDNGQELAVNYGPGYALLPLILAAITTLVLAIILCAPSISRIRRSVRGRP
ncbi:hypothetical protein CLV30_11537 [Haloactinopolyspora alba]|uniref:Uncharacterized protein n=1 Tax=Haloactinopolyspora alba TaxID=648780 RepID=A0A2P8DV63_9ACTN|nr:hypothetical protein [Haloactinopolyspora alba]PSL01102.1 hypothetical protein CLV30_11537 [Haloactinopolyspora alba]